MSPNEYLSMHFGRNATELINIKYALLVIRYHE